MLGNAIYEEQGATTGVRVLSLDADGTTLEVSIQTEGTIRGVAETTVWTYWSKTRNDGSIHYRGAIYFTTTSKRLRDLNGTMGVHEYDLDAQGKAIVKVWEWK